MLSAFHRICHQCMCLCSLFLSRGLNPLCHQPDLHKYDFACDDIIIHELLPLISSLMCQVITQWAPLSMPGIACTVW